MNKNKNISFWVTPKKAEKIRRLALDNKRGISGVCEEAIDHYLDHILSEELKYMRSKNKS